MAAFFATAASAASALRTVHTGFRWLSSSFSETRIPVQEDGEFKITVDPISTIALVALMRFKEPDTRIGVNRSSVEIQQPSEFQNDYVNWQWLHRTIRGDSREDLAIIKDAITFAAKLYKPQDNEEVERLFQHARKGLDAIAATYDDKSGLTCSAIKSWQELIDVACDEGIESESELTPVAAKVQVLWSETEPKIICDLLDEAERRQGDTRIQVLSKCDTQIDAIEVYLSRKNGEFLEILQQKE